MTKGARGVNVTGTRAAAERTCPSEVRRAVLTPFGGSDPACAPAPSLDWAGRVWECTPTMPASIARLAHKAARRSRSARLGTQLYAEFVAAVVIDSPAVLAAWEVAAPITRARLLEQIPALAGWYEQHDAIVEREAG